MAAKTKDAIYFQVVGVAHEYFGPAADRFVTRQIHSHLNKDPKQLRKQDLADLIEWIGLAMALLCDDEKVVSKFVADLKVLARTKK